MTQMLERLMETIDCILFYGKFMFNRRAKKRFPCDCHFSTDRFHYCVIMDAQQKL